MKAGAHFTLYILKKLGYVLLYEEKKDFVQYIYFDDSNGIAFVFVGSFYRRESALYAGLSDGGLTVIYG